MLIWNHFSILLNLSSQIWHWFMTFEITNGINRLRGIEILEGTFVPLGPLSAMLLVLREVRALGTYEYFQAFPVALEKICLSGMFNNFVTPLSSLDFFCD